MADQGSESPTKPDASASAQPQQQPKAEQAGPAQPAPGAQKKDEYTWGMLCHLAGIVVVVGPLIVWMAKKEEFASVNEHGKSVLNFQIPVAAALIGIWIVTGILAVFMRLVHLWGASLAILGLGSLLALVIYLINLIMVIMAAMKANEGKSFKYPLSVKLLH